MHFEKMQTIRCKSYKSCSWCTMFPLKGQISSYHKFNLSFFSILDAPVCSSDVDQLIGVTADESISINCRVCYYLKFIFYL